MLVLHSKLYFVTSSIYLKIELVQWTDSCRYEIMFAYLKGEKIIYTKDFDFLKKNIDFLDSLNAKKMTRKYYYIQEKIKKLYPNLGVL